MVADALAPLPRHTTTYSRLASIDDIPCDAYVRQLSLEVHNNVYCVTVTGEANDDPVFSLYAMQGGGGPVFMSRDEFAEFMRGGVLWLRGRVNGVETREVDLGVDWRRVVDRLVRAGVGRWGDAGAYVPPDGEERPQVYLFMLADGDFPERARWIHERYVALEAQL